MSRYSTQNKVFRDIAVYLFVLVDEINQIFTTNTCSACLSHRCLDCV